jgi:hypothetical protein
MAANAGTAPGFQSEAIAPGWPHLSLDNLNMARLNPRSIRWFLRSTTLKEWLAWSEHTQDQRVLHVLKPVLFDQQSGAIRNVEDRVLREELFRLTMVNDSFRRLLERKVATLDRITASYLQEQIEGL